MHALSVRLLLEKSNAEKRQRSVQREAMRSKREESADSNVPPKRSKTADTATLSIVSPLNYVGVPTATSTAQTLTTDDLKVTTKSVSKLHTLCTTTPVLLMPLWTDCIATTDVHTSVFELHTIHFMRRS